MIWVISTLPFRKLQFSFINAVEIIVNLNGFTESMSIGKEDVQTSLGQLEIPISRHEIPISNLLLGKDVNKMSRWIWNESKGGLYI